MDDPALNLIQVPPASASPIWPRIEGHLTKACLHSLGAHTVEETRERIESGQCQLWIVADEAANVPLTCTTSILDLPDGRRALLLELIAGEDPTEWFAIMAPLELWAKQNGCAMVALYCPKTWAKKLKSYDLLRYLMGKTL